MSSIIEGYNYDIFISYRQKDNKGDRWVSQFVEALKTELESTFKEEITVYFDINPHDGLLETHDVDASLKDKLKCLVFIPVISRTYCDPKSFAWENEFKVFLEQASQDRFGLKVRLPSGNVANRILPIKIHDLDPADIKLCESTLGSVLRGIEFIYKEAGIDKPLAPNDDEKNNINNTKYRIQIIKVTHAIKEIILGMKSEPFPEVKGKDYPGNLLKEVMEEKNSHKIKRPGKAVIRNLLLVLGIITILVITSILAYPKLFKTDRLETLTASGERISVAVMPFQNMTNDTIWNIWQDGIQDILINSLSNTEELRTRQAEFINSLVKNQGIVNYSSITPSVASKISQKLDAKIYIYGNIKKAGNTIRLSAQLVDSKSKEVFKSFQIEGIGREENIFKIVDSLSVGIKNLLVVSKLKQGHLHDSPSFISTSSPEAFRYFLNGRDFFYKRDYNSARRMFSRALAIDSNIHIVFAFVSISYSNQGMPDQAKEWCLQAYKRRELMPMMQKLLTNWLYSNTFESPNKEITHLKDILEIDDQSPTVHYILGNAYSGLYQYDKAIPEYEKSLELYERWDSKPRWIYNYTSLGDAYHNTGQYRKEEKLYLKAENVFSDDPVLLYNQAILALSEGKVKEANSRIEKYELKRKEMSWSEAQIANALANIYSDANIPDKAETYYRQALSLETGNALRYNNLAFFLIDNDRNINEGLELIEKAMELNLDEWYYADCKGWGLYKLGKFRESVDYLQKSWQLKPFYDHDLYLHLEAAQKAVAGQKEN
jgi:tetratricopeptide (TPR) repeat protein